MKPNIIVYALAGTGKTFTIVEGVNYLRGEATPSIVPSSQQAQIWDQFGIEDKASAICLAAFSNHIKCTLEKQIDSSLNCDVLTFHGMGYRAIRNEMGLSGDSVKLNKWKTTDIIRELNSDASVRALNTTMPGYVNMVRQLVGYSKFACEAKPGNDTLYSMAANYDVPLGAFHNEAFDSVRDVLQKSLEDTSEVDFNDMPWMPIMLNMPIKEYDTLFVDEGQDLNHCQQELALRAGRRIILVGDKHQAIFGFAGADTKSMDTMLGKLHVEERGYCSCLPLTVSRRCSQAVAERARLIVPEFEAHPDNCEGNVGFGNLDGITTSDMVLCRINAPLIGTAFSLISKHVPAKIIGRDMKSCMTGMIESIQPGSVSDLMFKSRKAEEREVKYFINQKPVSEAAIIAVHDRYECLRSLCDHVGTLQELTRTIEMLFINKDSKVDCVRLSSIHRAKGLEAPSVYVLHPELLPHPMASTNWQREQESNLKYVAITRAQRNLIWVEGD